MSLSLGVLDLLGALDHTLELAPAADQLGFGRYWIAEHQPQPSATLIAATVASITEQLRVGTAGILLHYLGPQRAAHDFHYLERLHPGRIDAGFCAGIIPDARLYADDLDGRKMPEIFGRYRKRVEKLVRRVRDVSSDVRWAGAPPAPPALWYLGGSETSGAHAGALGTHFACALMFPHNRDDPAAIAAYREHWRRAGALERPHAVISVAGVCAATDDEAAAIAGRSAGSSFQPWVVGEPRRCADQLAELRERMGADEVVFANLSHELDDRRRCLELLATAAL